MVRITSYPFPTRFRIHAAVGSHIPESNLPQLFLTYKDIYNHKYLNNVGFFSYISTISNAQKLISCLKTFPKNMMYRYMHDHKAILKTYNKFIQDFNLCTDINRINYKYPFSLPLLN